MTVHQARPFTGRHMWLLALAFFGVVIAVNAVMATVALRSWTGLTVENSYVASQEFDAKRRAHTAQAAAGWIADLHYEGNAMLLRVRDAGGNPVTLGAATLLVNRPVGGHDDRDVILQRAADGTYSAEIDLPAGTWDAMVTAPDTPLGFFEIRERFHIGAGS